MGYVVYSSNNSGGYWWLDDEDWAALEAAGWTVVWTWLSEKYNDDGGYERDPETGIPLIVPVAENNSRYINLIRDVKPGDRWLGALATTAYRAGLSLRQAVDEWERITGENSTAAGCPCCGQPHSFTEYTTEGKYVASGPETVFEARWS